MVEIGGGEGNVAREVLDYARLKKVKPATYRMFDISLTLLSMQREATQKSGKNTALSYALSDALRLPIRQGSADLFISNEVIADFPVIKNLSPEDIRNFPSSCEDYKPEERRLLAQAAGYIRGFDLDIPDGDEKFHFNIGALQFLYGVKSALKTGGVAFITEYSSEVERTDYWDKIPGFFLPPTGIEFPEEVELDGHSEFSIKFSHLEKMARKIGLEVELGPLHEFVGLKDFNLLEDLELDEYPLDPLKILMFKYLLLKKTPVAGNH